MRTRLHALPLPCTARRQLTRCAAASFAFAGPGLASAAQSAWTRRMRRRRTSEHLAWRLAGRCAPVPIPCKMQPRNAECVPSVAVCAQAGPVPSASVDALPSRTADGQWVYKTAAAEPQQRSEPARAAPDGDVRGRPCNGGPAAAAEAGAAGAAAGDPGSSAARQRAAASSAPRASAAAELEQLQDQELSLAQKKERIAAACTALLEAPERHVSELRVRAQPACFTPVRVA